MAIADSISRLASTFLSLAHTRLELASVELEEERQRLFSYVLLGLAALFCISVAALLTVFLVVAIFWDTHRIAAILTLIAIFGVISLFIVVGLRQSFQNKPRFMGHTLNEFKRDYEKMHPHHASTPVQAPE